MTIAAQLHVGKGSLPTTMVMREVSRGGGAWGWGNRNDPLPTKDGWQGMPSRPSGTLGGLLITEQELTDGVVAQVERSFSHFYGAATRLNVMLGAQLANLGPSITEEAAKLEGVRRVHADRDASIAVVREGANFVLREALSPMVGTPYLGSGEPDQPKVSATFEAKWEPLRFNAEKRPSTFFGRTGEVDRIKFLSPSVRAIIDGANLVENMAAEQ